tara:strand:- start:3000 stop:3593 length:594 start_codon:yes stop_codon:yes gene_type:complete
MAYSLPSLNTAANYLASYRRVQPVSGFEDVLSTDASDTLARQQELQFAAKVGMAKQALNNLTQKLINDANIEYKEGADDKILKANKMNALGNLMGGGSNSRSGGSQGLTGPLDLLNAFNQKVDSSYAYVDNTQGLEDGITQEMVGGVFDGMFGSKGKRSSQQSAQKAPVETLQFKSTGSVADQLQKKLEAELRKRSQ